MFCDKCGAVNQDDSKFCENCGSAIGHGSQPDIQPAKRKNSAFRIIIPIAAIVLAVLIAIGIIFAHKHNGVEALLTTAEKYLENGDYEDAISTFNKIIEIDSKNIDAYMGLADTYVIMAEEMIDQGNSEDGMEYYRKAVETLENASQYISSKKIENKKEEIEEKMGEDKPDEKSSAMPSALDPAVITFDFYPTDFTILGYYVEEDHSEDVMKALEEKGIKYTVSDTGVISFLEYCYYCYGKNGNNNRDSRISGPGTEQVYDGPINVGDSIEKVEEFFQIDKIKSVGVELGDPVPGDEYECQWYSFQSNYGDTYLYHTSYNDGSIAYAIQFGQNDTIDVYFMDDVVYSVTWYTIAH